MKLLSILIIALGANYSFAAHLNEAVWQAHGGSNVVHTGYSYTSRSTHNSNATSSANDDKTNVNRISLDYERGLTDSFSLGLGLDYISLSSGAGFDAAGVEHINVFFKGNMALGFGGFHYGLGGRISLGDNETDTDGANNAALGRTEITPYLALVMGDREMGYGFKAAYQYNTKTKRTDDRNTTNPDQEMEGGDMVLLSAFYEMTLTDKSLFGVSLNYDIGTNFTDSNDNDISGKENVLGLNFYGAVTCGCDKGGLSFLPKFTLMQIDGEDVTGLVDTESGTAYAMEFALRKTF